MRFAGLNYIVANAVGYLIGFIISFTLNRSWTFEHSGPVLQGALQWALLVAIAYGLNVSIVIAAHNHLGVNPYIAQILGVLAYTLATFFGARHYVFREAHR